MLVRWMVVSSFVGFVRSDEVIVSGKPPDKLGTLPWTPTTSHLYMSFSVTKHPLFNYYQCHTAYYKYFSDIEWHRQWYAQDYRYEDMPVMDLNLVPVYNEGITGEGITVAVVGSGGIDADNPDLTQNIDTKSSFDTCLDVPNIKPLGSWDNLGTLTAGVIAMAANNKICGVGVAYKSKVIGIKYNIPNCRQWDYKNEVHKPLQKALQYKQESIRIYTNNWKLPSFQKSSPETNSIIEYGTERKEGNIYVFSAGDMGMTGERSTCASNGLFNLPSVIGVNGASQTGKVLSYGERCSAIFATTYAYENNGIEQGIVTTNNNGNACETTAVGTWAAGAFASGIMALTLQANSSLSSRDMMHIIALGAEVAPLADNRAATWKMNAAGFWVSLNFGFGLMNALNMVTLAKEWKGLPPSSKSELTLVAPLSLTDSEKFEVGQMWEKRSSYNGNIKYLEQVVVTATIRFANREALQIYLTSPKGSNVTILEGETGRHGKDLEEWSFKSVHFWGEDPSGEWIVQIKAKEKPTIFNTLVYGSSVAVQSLILTFYGTEVQPYETPRKYAGFWLRNLKCSDSEEEKKVISSIESLSTRPDASCLSSEVTKHPIFDADGDLSRYRREFIDPWWKYEWYAQDYRLKAAPVMDLNLVPVYRRGYTGKSVTIGIIGDGVDGTHPDLKDNYIQRLSVDVCVSGGKAIPSSQNDVYGTLAAGVIAMAANNKFCGVGVAYEAKIAGIKTCGKKNFNSALNYNLADFDIYNIGWAGLVMDPLTKLEESSLENGRTLGRRTKGVIYVINAKKRDTSRGPTCAKYALLNKHGVIVVNGASQKGRVLKGNWCSSVLAATYGSGPKEDGIVTTTVGGQCIRQKQGFWSPSAFASGMIALILQAKPTLTYRDVMHIITMSAEVAPLADLNDEGYSWFLNKAGFWINKYFGFGLMNAENMLTLALNWTPVPELKIYKKQVIKDKTILGKNGLCIYAYANFDVDDKSTDILFLEEIELIFTMEYTNRGDMEVSLESPDGTETDLLNYDFPDGTSNGLNAWRIKTTHFWGESPIGKWKLLFRRTIRHDKPCLIKDVTIVLYGTSEKPSHYENGPRTYAPFRMVKGHTSETKPTKKAPKSQWALLVG